MRESSLNRRLNKIASLRLTVFFMVGLAVGTLLNYRNIFEAQYLVLLPLGLLAINLFAALIVNHRIRRSTPLYLFHITLFVLLCLILVDDQFSLQARVELSESQDFNPAQVVTMKAGKWYTNSLETISFKQGDISVSYGPGRVRGYTRSHIAVISGKSISDQYIGDDTPLKVNGYKFYTTHNKGFSAVLGWQPDGGARLNGTVHFPSYPGFEWKQDNYWELPMAEPLALRLILSDSPPENTGWVLSREFSDMQLSIDQSGSQYLLSPGQSIELDSGVLTFARIHMWMGYRITYNPVLPWLFIVSMLGTLFLGWYFWVKFSVLDTGYRASMLTGGSNV